MSRARSSRAAAVTLLALGLTACSHGPSGPSGTKASGVLGYVNMDALLKVHPLYGELSRMDADVEALQIKALGASVPRATGADLAREEKALQKELAAATDRTKKALHDKQDEYAKREQLAINAALAAAGGPPGPSGAAIAGGIARQSQVQGRSVAGAAQSDFDRYRRTLLEQNRQDLMAVQRALDDKASRTYRTKVEELQRKEADLSLSEAHADAAERLSLTSKLQNLALDDSSREDTRKQLAALNQKESDAVAALKNRDQATLASLQTQLHKQTSDELERRARDMNRQTAAKIDARGRQTQLALVNQIAQVPPGPQGGGVALPVNLPPDLRAKLMTLHKK